MSIRARRRLPLVGLIQRLRASLHSCGRRGSTFAIALASTLALTTGGCAPTVVREPPPATVTIPPATAPTPVTATQATPAPIPPVDGVKPEPPTEWAPEPPPPAWGIGPSAAEIALAAAPTPADGRRYVCVRQTGGGEVRTPIQLPPGTERICSRHPAMGPCQYERDVCRRSGGRVIRFDGVDITPEIEREYDKQVTRIRLNAG